MTPQVGAVSGQLTVERAIKVLLERWLPTYVVAAARRYGINPVSTGFPFRPSGVLVVPEFVDNTGMEPPYVQIATPQWQLSQRTEKGYRIEYAVNVYAVVSGRELEDVRLARACYEDAILGVVAQHQSLGVGADGVNVVGGGSSQTDVSADDARTLQASVTMFQVFMDGVLNPFTGPATPEPLPDQGGGPPVWPEDPDAGIVNVTILPEPVIEPD